MGEKIIVEVAPDGSVKVAVECGSGASCAELTEGIERALGKRTADEKLQEFYQEAQQPAGVKVRS